MKAVITMLVAVVMSAACATNATDPPEGENDAQLDDLDSAEPLTAYPDCHDHTDTCTGNGYTFVEATSGAGRCGPIYCGGRCGPNRDRAGFQQQREHYQILSRNNHTESCTRWFSAIPITQGCNCNE